MKFEFSAGGIVYKRGNTQNNKDKSQNNAENILVLVSQHSQHHGWVFPKGLIGDHTSKSSGQVVQGEKKSASAPINRGFGETKEEAAVREVKEETGVEAQIVRGILPVTYWYVFDHEKIKKTVYYYVMKFTGGDIEKHDQEMENVEWVEFDKVLEKLTYKSDKQAFEEAKDIIVKLAGL